MLKRLLPLATHLAASLLISTAAFAQTKGGRANVIVQPEPPGLMVGLVQNGPTQMVAGNIYEGLLRYDPQLKPLPQLAKSWTVSMTASPTRSRCSRA